MKYVLITGVNGLVGSNLARQLIADGCSVRGLVRPGSDLRSIGGLDIDLVVGDVLDPGSIRTAVSGVDTVFHTAAVISYWRRERERMFAVNIDGTRHVVAASIQAGEGRFVHTSSIAAMPLRTSGEITTEESPHDGEFFDVGYRISKYRSEQVVLEAVRNGLDAVILNPVIIMGPGDYRFHGGRMIKDVYSGRIFYSPPGGSSVVSVRDVVQAHIAAAQRGRTGERYILCGENYTFKDIFRTTAEVVGGIPPLFTVPGPLVKAVASISESVSSLFGVKPWVSRELVAGIEITKRYSADKARRELGFSPMGLRDTIRTTFEWYKESGML